MCSVYVPQARLFEVLRYKRRVGLPVVNLTTFAGSDAIVK